MVNLIIFNYYYRYKQSRNIIKDLVDNLDFQQAKNRLVTSIQEQENFYGDLISNTINFNSTENGLMRHANSHLDTVIIENDPEYIDNNGNIKHQSDIVKEELDR